MIIRLKSAASYRGYGVTATRRSPCIEVDDDKAAVLIGSGFFVAAKESCAACSPPEPPALPDRAIGVTDVMTVKELRAYAVKKGIDLSGVKTKTQLVKIIREWEEKQHGTEAVDTAG